MSSAVAAQPSADPYNASSQVSEDSHDEDVPPFEPPDNPFERGAYPVENPWLRDMTGLRQAHGLDASRNVVADLMGRSGAQVQVLTYGVLLTPDEEADYAYQARARDILDKALGAVEGHAGFAGVILSPSARPYGAQVLATEQHYAEIELMIESSLAAEVGDVPAVTLATVSFSLQELQAAAASLRVRMRVDETEVADETVGKVTPQKSDAAYRVLADRADLVGVNIGYSMRDNTLVVYAPPETFGNEELIDLGPDYPQAKVVAIESEEDHHTGHDGDTPDDQDYSDGCGRWWCGAAKGGVQTDYQMSNGDASNCSTSPAIQVKSSQFSLWETKHVSAGHCGDSGTETWYRFALEGSNSLISTHFGVVVNKSSQTKLGTEWRNSLYRSGAAWGDFVLINGTPELTANNLMLTSSTSSVRVTQLGTVWVDGTVCISVNHVDPPLCDTVDDIGETKTIEGKSVINLATTRGTYEGEMGDSGGPLYRQGSPHVFVGVHQGEKTDFLLRTWQLFSRSTLIDDSNMNLHSTRTVPTDGVRDFIQGLYARNLNRSPDYTGYNSWVSDMTPCNKGNAADVAESFLISIEFKNRFPINTSNSTVNYSNAQLRIWYAYQTYFGRSPDSAGFNYWYGELANGIASGQGNATWESILDWWGFGVDEFTNRVNGAGVFPVDGYICA